VRQNKAQRKVRKLSTSQRIENISSKYLNEYIKIEQWMKQREVSSAS
jgi:hypothetical protein